MTIEELELKNKKEYNMTQPDELRIIADALEGKIKLEVNNAADEWSPLDVSGERFVMRGSSFSWNPIDFVRHNSLEDGFIRIAKSLSLLSDDDADFAEKYLPHDWWIARDSDEQSGKIFFYELKPIKSRVYWISAGSEFEHNKDIPTFPKFESIKWENDDCCTVQELLDHYYYSIAKMPVAATSCDETKEDNGEGLALDLIEYANIMNRGKR